ncbi:MAG: hypothetical protein FJ087_06735 [Deltaproteobacteria bacterium]|nr:hypothetical protein [Deltaproteobacteria bacterium]
MTVESRRPVALFVEGVSDKPAIKRLCELAGFSSVPVRAGHAQWQGAALLSRWRDIVRLVSQEKVVFLFDRDMKAAVDAEIICGRERPVPGRKVVMLVAPWKGIEEFTEQHLGEADLADYKAARASGASKKELAERFGRRLAR